MYMACERNKGKGFGDFLGVKPGLTRCDMENRVAGDHFSMVLGPASELLSLRFFALVSLL
jgi:hypothetical protein